MAAYYIKDKVAIVTGGASGIGLSCVKELLRIGLRGVTIGDINEAKGQEAVNEINNQFGENRAIFLKTDVTNPEEFEAIFKKTLETWQGVDIVLNNAGIMNDNQWEKEIGINCNAVVRGSLMGMQYMGKDRGGNGGIIINIASILGLQPLASCPIHVATKHFVIGFNRSLGTPFHYSRTGVKVLTICPGITDTPHLQEASKNAIKSLHPDIGNMLTRELKGLPFQSTDTVAKAMITIIGKGENGSVWVIEGNNPVYEIVRTFKPMY